MLVNISERTTGTGKASDLTWFCCCQAARWIFLLVSLFTVMGCGGRAALDSDPFPDDSNAACVPGLQIACACLGGSQGTQVCLPSETFGPCDCPEGPGGSGGSGMGSSGAGTGGGGGPLAGPTPTEIAVRASHVIADPVRGVFYATVGGDAPEHANSLVTIAASGGVLSSVFVGSQPWTMALSDDASTLWVSLRGSYEIRRVDLTPNTPVAQEKFKLPPGDFGDLAYAGPMVVLPGTAESVALSLHYEGLSPSYAGSVVLDSGIPRPDMTPGHTGASRLTGGPDGWVFGFNNLHTGFGFYSLEVSPSGLSSSEYGDLVNGFYTDIVYAGGRVYATSGEVVDVSNPASPVKAGEFAFGGHAVLPLTPSPRLLMLSVEFVGPVTLRLLDTVTFSQIDSRQYADLQLEDAADLVSPDGKSLAFIGTSGFDEPPRLFVVTNPFDGK